MLELSFDVLDGYIKQICSGQRLFYVKDRFEAERPLLLKYPTEYDLLIADLVYKQALKEAEELGLPSIAEVEYLIRERGFFSSADEEKVEKLRSRVEGQKAILAKATRVPARRGRIEESIEILQKEIEKILVKKESKLENTRERKASEARYLYLTQKGIFNPFTVELFWPTKEAFEQEPDFEFRRRVFVEYIIFSYGLKEEIIRYVARSNVWRIRYLTATKTSDPLFGAAIKDYSVDQLMLLYWSHYYQSLNEMLPDERPADEIVEDDQALDAYMKDWHENKNRETVASRAKKGQRAGEKSAWDHSETIVTKSNPLHQDIQYSETLITKAKGAKDSILDAAPISKSKSKR